MPRLVKSEKRASVLKKIHDDSNATKIQSIYRGHKSRKLSPISAAKDSIKMGESHIGDVSKDSLKMDSGITLHAHDSLKCGESGIANHIKDSLKVMESDIGQHAVNSAKLAGPPASSTRGEVTVAAEDDNDDEDAQLDEEEETLVKAAVALEEAASQKALDITDRMPAGNQRESPTTFRSVDESSTWPEPLEDAFDETWPAMGGGDYAGVERWVREHKTVLMRTITWNLCAKEPPPVESATVKLLPRNRFHIVVVGSEECERSIAQSALNTSKRNWESYLISALGEHYVPLKSHTLQAIHLICFVHKAVAHMVSDVRSAAVPTGVGNTMGNKGGVGIHFAVGQTSFVVVNSHLAAHQNAVKARNADFKLISRGIPVALNRKTPGRTSPKLAADIASRAEKKEEGSEMVGEGVSRAKRESKMDRESKDDRPQLHACADRVVFMGDLNYRIRGNRAAVSALLRQGMRDVLLNNDQLTWSRQQGLALNHFTEPPLNFRPTYKFDVGPDIDTDSYDTGPKKRIPAWTDRILYASGSCHSFEQTQPGMRCTAYNADMSLRSSDHRPVYASFRAQVDVGDMVEAAEAAAVAEGKEGNGDACGANKEVPAFSSESQVCSIM